ESCSPRDLQSFPTRRSSDLRAMWTGLYPDKPEDAVPIGHITNGVHVPTWLAPQMFRLYDRHFGPGWHERSSDARIWEGIEQVDRSEEHTSELQSPCNLVCRL